MESAGRQSARVRLAATLISAYSVQQRMVCAHAADAWCHHCNWRSRYLGSESQLRSTVGTCMLKTTGIVFCPTILKLSSSALQAATPVTMVSSLPRLFTWLAPPSAHWRWLPQARSEGRHVGLRHNVLSAKRIDQAGLACPRIWRPEDCLYNSHVHVCHIIAQLIPVNGC